MEIINHFEVFGHFINQGWISKELLLKLSFRPFAEERNGSLTLTSIRHSPPFPISPLILFSPAFSVFVLGRGAYCVVACCSGIVDGLGLTF